MIHKYVLIKDGDLTLAGKNFSLKRSREQRDALMRELNAKISRADAPGPMLDKYDTSFMGGDCGLVDLKAVVGLVVIAQHADGTQYWHSVGAIDVLRALGLAQLELTNQANNEVHNNWVAASLGRRQLEDGL
jgi:hypothetical protein